MSDKLILHLGAHRTGSSYIQALFGANREILIKRHICFEYFHEVKRLRGAAIKARGLAESNQPQEFSRAFEPIRRYFLDQTSSPSETTFLSYEGLLGSIRLSSPGAIYPATQLIADSIKDILESKRFVVGFSVRNTGDFVESTYKYCVRGGMTQSFKKYYGHSNADALTWKPVVQALVNVFGPNHVLVWSHERFSADSRRILDALFSRADVDSSFMDQFTPLETRVNSSSSSRALDIMRQINAVLDKERRPSGLLQGLSWKQNRRLAKSINSLVENSLPIKEFGHPQLLTQEQALLLTSNYRSDLAFIQELLGENALV
jgi:hypothetical protein